MHPISAPLRPGDQGSEVANLQVALTLLLAAQAFAVDPAVRAELLGEVGREAQERSYRDATAKTVAIFQEGRGLRADGTVDEVTAAALDDALRALGALGADDGRRLVAGQVVGTDRTPFGGRVILVEENGAGPVHLGEDATDPEGRYAISYLVPDGGERAALRVAAYDTEGQRRAEAAVETSRPVEVVDLVVSGAGPTYRVSGRLVSAARAGVGGLRVVVVDRNVGGDTPVAEATTGPDGGYRAAFTYAGPKPRPDLQAYAVGADTRLGASQVRYDAAHDEVLDIVVAATAQPALATEHATLVADLGRHVAGPLGDLRESADRADVTYLANKTGWDARAVAMAALADQFGARAPGIPAALFYTLFRAGMPATDDAVYRTDAGRVEALWRHGVDQGLVPADLAGQIPAAVKQFRTLAARQALSAPAAVGRSSLADMLAVSLPDADADQHEAFARLRLEHQGDPERFWTAVQKAFGKPATQRLRLDGRLGYLTLNNAPLIARLHAADAPLADPVELLDRGLHQPGAWRPLIDAAPPEIPGPDEEVRQARYAEVLATQLRLSYPTAAVAAMVAAGETPVATAVRDQVRDFLREHHETFAIGLQPVDQYAARAGVQLAPQVRTEIARIQRVRQITPGDDEMNVLLGKGIDSAAAVARYDRAEFVASFAGQLGEATAALVHARAQQVHSAVLNIATSYVLASRAPGIGVHSPAQIVNPAPVVPANVGDVIAYPTLEKLLGDMDYCDCSECRSVLSPAAYLVDLLQFLDRDDVRWAQFLDQWRVGHDGAPYPYPNQAAWVAAGSPAEPAPNPLQVLLQLRPDLQHLPLTCENTNTPVPYIDLVNETLEYYVANKLTLAGFQGHTTDDRATPAELLANPQFVRDAAYQILAGPDLPAGGPLPFDLPLERLRRLFAAFGTSLPRVLEALRRDGAGYGWDDIWVEQLGVSPAERALLTDPTLTLRQLYGFAPGTSEVDVVAALSNAKAFCQRLDVSYDELVQLLRTRYVNPDGQLIPRVERLGVPLATLRALHDGTISDAQFDAVIAPQLDPAAYGGDIKAWVRNPANYERIMGLLVLADPGGAAEASRFDALEFRYADPARLAQPVRPAEFAKLARFIRLWRRLGWSIEATDKAVGAFYPASQVADDSGWAVLLPRLGVLARVLERLGLTAPRDVLPLLACFAPLDTYGATSLYRTLFLNPTLLAQDAVFADDGYGTVLAGPAKLLAHEAAVRAALNLTGEDFAAIVTALDYDADTPLGVAEVSAIFRRGWLARLLKLSVPELLALTAAAGIDPFAGIDPARPAILALLDLIDALRTAGLTPTRALYLIWDRDPSGTASPAAAQVDDFMRTLRATFAAVEEDFAILQDPDGQVARARMALVYGDAATDKFFGLLDNTLVSATPYGHPGPELAAAVLAAAPGRIGYDDFRKQLSYAGAMTAAARDALKAADPAPAFGTAVDALYAENQRTVRPFFARYVELEPLYDAYVASADPPERKRSALLAAFLPALRERRKRQQAMQVVGAAATGAGERARAGVALAAAVLDDPAVLHAAGDPATGALADLVAIGRHGLTADFYPRDTPTGEAEPIGVAEAVLDYRPGENPLPGNGGNPISVVLRGRLEAPTSEAYQIRVEAGADATVTLSLGGAPVALVRSGDDWVNASPIELRAGALYAITLTAARVHDRLAVRWQTVGRGWQVIPGRFLYSAGLRERLAPAYTRFFKIASLVEALRLTPAEFAHLAADPDHRIDGAGWANALPAGAPAAPVTGKALGAALTGLLGFTELKAVLSPDDERLLAALRDPVTVLPALTGWEPGSAQAVLDHFGVSAAGLAKVPVLRRVWSVFAQLSLLGVPAAALIAAATLRPAPETVRDLQGSLRARYALADWLDVVKPINDALRARRRDALVAYVLHQMRAHPESAHIDTPDKLFEYFLIDVQMEPVMQTSRIRSALSTVQLFVERCMLNLEPRVAASALNARAWEWMKLYRLWEANRKVFLWPENWLEPELRDDQSPFFKELMSELLQGDITEDRAAVALTGYLSKLDTVAKLEPCALHYAEHEPGVTDDVAYVVARTAGAGRTYYWRRREHGSWTPWEQIKLDIADDPVLPVLWKNRLFLFWLKIMTPPDLTGAGGPQVQKDKNLTEIKVSELKKTMPLVEVKALLCWSEYYGGAWQPAKTSDPNRPTKVTDAYAGGFEAASLRLTAAVAGDTLQIGFADRARPAFVLYNSHSQPVRGEDVADTGKPAVGPRRYLSTGHGRLTSDYGRFTTPDSPPLNRPILDNPLGGRVVDPTHDLVDAWNAPFFYGDSRHVFYVRSESEQITLGRWHGYVSDPPSPPAALGHFPPMVYKQVAVRPNRLGPVVRGLLAGVGEQARMQHFVSEDAYITKGLATLGTVDFGDNELGPAGALGPRG